MIMDSRRVPGSGLERQHKDGTSPVMFMFPSSPHNQFARRPRATDFAVTQLSHALQQTGTLTSRRFFPHGGELCLYSHAK
jgi:hypothetical protein